MKKIWLLSFLWVLASLQAQVITGTVKDLEKGYPLEGVLVSNEREVVRTDVDGKFTLPRNEKSRFVFVVPPSDRDEPGRWQRLTEATEYHFALKAKEPAKGFTFIHIADTETASDQETLQQIMDSAASEQAAFILHTGDICREKGLPFHAEHLNYKTAKRPVYYCVGNHDLTGEHGHGESQFEELFGPTRYAFEEGGCLFIITPMLRGDHRPSYTEEDVVLFVKNLLALVDKNQPVYLANHYSAIIHPRGILGTHTQIPVDLNQWNFKAFIYGHTHHNHAVKCGKGMLFNTVMSRGGGIGENAAAYRFFAVKPDGDFTTEIRPLHLQKLSSVHVSPAPDADGKYTIAAFVGNTVDAPKQVVAQVNGERLPLTQASQLLWTGSSTVQPKGEVAIQVFSNGISFSGKGSAEVTGAKDLGLTLERVAYVPGIVMYGTPAVAGNLAFFGISGDATGEEGGVAALELDTGKLRWFRHLPSGLRGAPVFAEGKVIACNANSVIYALDPDTGKSLWTNLLEIETIGGSYFSTPLVADGVIYAGACNVLRAVSLADGKTLWTNTAPGRNTALDQPILHQGRLIYTAEWDTPRALDSKTGKLLWTVQPPPPKVKPWLPTLAPLDEKRILMLGGQYSAVLDAETGQELASNRKMRVHTLSKPVLFEGMLFKGSVNRGLLVLDPETLKEKFALPLGSSILRTVQYNSNSTDLVEATPVIHDGYLYVAHSGGRLYRIKPAATKAATELKYLELNSPLMAAPVIQDGRLIQTDYSGRVFIFRFL
ncbi:MAG: PQQ-binding-like beta-propeller repeat protein [Victivallales bacterium]|nr:PQQ-binding-like beta-propeller repeat protein [Victivallales bacterium]